MLLQPYARRCNNNFGSWRGGRLTTRQRLGAASRDLFWEPDRIKAACIWINVNNEMGPREGRMLPLDQWPVEVKQEGSAWTVLFGGREEARCRSKIDATEIGRDIASRT